LKEHATGREENSLVANCFSAANTSGRITTLGRTRRTRSIASETEAARPLRSNHAAATAAVRE
jgi:hypothetical protein